jgi:hypothetical protein
MEKRVPLAQSEQGQQDPRVQPDPMEKQVPLAQSEPGPPGKQDLQAKLDKLAQQDPLVKQV